MRFSRTLPLVLSLLAGCGDTVEVGQDPDSDQDAGQDASPDAPGDAIGEDDSATDVGGDPGAARECARDADCPAPSGVCERAVCEAGRCVARVQAPGAGCDDGVDCTTNDACDDQGQCAGSVDHARCVDARMCNGLEACAPSDPGADPRGCVAGVAPQAPDDGIACTVSVCDEEAATLAQVPGPDCACDAPGAPCEGDVVGQCPRLLCASDYTCQSAPCECQQDADCADRYADDPCVVGVCGEGLRCEPRLKDAGSACDDGVACTTGTLCDDQGACVGGALDDALCDDGLYCNGPERCSPLGCEATPDPVLLHPPVEPCVALSCDEEADQVLQDDAACGSCQDVSLYTDSDGDGFGAGAPVLACVATDEPLGQGVSREGGDCGPSDPLRHPSAQEICGDWVDDNCDNADSACPTSQPATLDIPSWDCRTGPTPANVYAWAEFAPEDEFFQDGGCFLFFRGAPGEFYAKKVGFVARQPGYTCPTQGNAYAYDERMYAHTVVAPANECPPLELIVHGPGERMQPASTDCRKFLFQLSLGSTLSFVAASVEALEERLERMGQVEVSCSPYDGFWRSSFYHSSLMVSQIQHNPLYQE